MRKPIFIGIDPAFRLNGFGICIIDHTKEISYKTFRSVADYLFFILRLDADNVVVSCIENSNLQPEMFKYKTEKPKTKAEQINQAQNVGKNQATSQIVYDFTKRLYPNTTYQVSPKGKGAKPTPLQARQLAKGFTQLVVPSNQDEADALKLAIIAMNKFNRV